MKRRRIEFVPDRPECPLTFWVHKEADGQPWHEATVFDPPRPGPIAGRGYAVFHVEFDGVELRFASLQELRVCIETLGTKVLPSTRALSEALGSGVGPNAHWLSRLPAKAKPWRYREKAVRYLAEAEDAFRQELARLARG